VERPPHRPVPAGLLTGSPREPTAKEKGGWSRLKLVGKCPLVGSASPTSARARATRPRTARSSRRLKKLRCDAERPSCPRGLGQARRDLVPDAMGRDTARADWSDWQGPQSDWEPATMSIENIVFVAIELSFSSWLVAARLPGTERVRLHRIEGGTRRRCWRCLGSCARVRRPSRAKSWIWRAASRRAGTDSGSTEC
jgi:hypothetical protein